MKIRTGFVSNSSSSSFVVKKKHLTDVQIEYIQYLTSLPSGVGEYHDWWDVTVDDDEIRGYTSMDNGGKQCGLYFFLKANGFPMQHIEWYHYG